MTILDDIKITEINMLSTGLEKLKHISAPEIVIEKCLSIIEKLKNGSISIKNADTLGNIEFISKEEKKGRGGKLFIQYTTENNTINYFPQARFGRCLFINKPRNIK